MVQEAEAVGTKRWWKDSAKGQVSHPLLVTCSYIVKHLTDSDVENRAKWRIKIKKVNPTTILGT